MNKLYQLSPNGNWVDLKLVASVMAYEGSSLSNRPYVVVLLNDGKSMPAIYCDSFSEAQTIRDQIAKKVNDEVL
jgi:hypothetical protein